MSDPPQLHKNKSIIFPKCGRNGHYAIDCPNESGWIICGGNRHCMVECPTKSTCKKLIGLI